MNIPNAIRELASAAQKALNRDKHKRHTVILPEIGPVYAPPSSRWEVLRWINLPEGRVDLPTTNYRTQEAALEAAREWRAAEPGLPLRSACGPGRLRARAYT